MDGCSFYFFFKQKTAYEMRISDWSSDVCSSDLARRAAGGDLDQPAALGHRPGAPRLSRRRGVHRYLVRFPALAGDDGGHLAARRLAFPQPPEIGRAHV